MDAVGLCLLKDKDKNNCDFETRGLLHEQTGFGDMSLKIIGKEIFLLATTKSEGTTTTNCNDEDFSSFKTSQTRKSVQVFFEAYGSGDILHSLSLNKAHVFFNDIIDDCWWIFEQLVCLDLSSCGIGDGHDVLALLEGLQSQQNKVDTWPEKPKEGTREQWKNTMDIASLKMRLSLIIRPLQQLQTLVLKDNMLTNEGVRKLTVRSRMFQKSSSVLKYLDISSNTGITIKSISFLRYLPTLALLNVSNTSITFQETVSLTNWQACTRKNVCDCVNSCFLVRTEGWSAFLLESWKHNYERTGFKPVDSAESVSQAANILGQRFYSRSKSKTVTAASYIVSANETQENSPPLLLMSHFYSCNHFQHETDISSQTDSPQEKCKASVSPRVLACNVKPQSVCRDQQTQEVSSKTRTRSTVTEYDYDESVLSQYRCSPPKKKLKRVSLLQQLEDFDQQT